MKKSIKRASSFENSSKLVTSQSLSRGFFLKITKGFEKGTIFKLSGHEVMIGRDPANHIQLKKDTKVSRHHVQMYWEKSQYVLKNVTKNNVIRINGIETSEARLKGNEIIQIGDHDLQFIVYDKPLLKRKKARDQGNPRNLIIILFIIGVALYSLIGPSHKNIAEKSEIYETEEVAERRVGNIEEVIDSLKEKIKSSDSYRYKNLDAESIYIRGKRDFDRGQFFYAKDAFRAVLSIDSEHSHARRMLRLSVQYADDLLERQFKEGLANRDVGRYEMCKSDMKNVMNMIDNPKSPRYTEARKILIECNLRKMEAY